MSVTAACVPQDQSFAAIAVELHLAKNNFAEVSFAVAVLAMMRADRLETLTRIANKCGVESLVVERIMLDEEKFTSLIAEAHRLFKAMIPHEGAVRSLIVEGGGDA